jgi:hypothetical protein
MAFVRSRETKMVFLFPRRSPGFDDRHAGHQVFSSISLVMFGALLLIFTFRKPVNGFYAWSMSMSLAVLWAVRVVVQIVSPQGTPFPPLQYGMLTAFILVFQLSSSSFSSFLIVDDESNRG